MRKISFSHGWLRCRWVFFLSNFCVCVITTNIFLNHFLCYSLFSSHHKNISSFYFCFFFCSNFFLAPTITFLHCFISVSVLFNHFILSLYALLFVIIKVELWYYNFMAIIFYNKGTISYALWFYLLECQFILLCSFLFYFNWNDHRDEMIENLSGTIEPRNGFHLRLE